MDTVLWALLIAAIVVIVIAVGFVWWRSRRRAGRVLTVRPPARRGGRGRRGR